jgi:hypothetical protein
MKTGNYILSDYVLFIYKRVLYKIIHNQNVLKIYYYSLVNLS